MRRLRLAVALALVPILVGCGSPAPEPVMPEVMGKTLDVAKSDIKRAGFSGEVEILGGGIFGILDEKNWVVCEQMPLAGNPIADEPRLEVDRSCGDEEAEPSETPTAPEPSVTPSKEAPPPAPDDDAELEEDEPDTDAVSAKTVEKRFKEHLRNNEIKKISAMCDDAFTHWACFYDGVEGDSETLWVKLTTDGGWSTAELEGLARSAGLHWFNFIGCDFPELGTIVVDVNGLEHNVFRWDTNVDALC